MGKEQFYRTMYRMKKITAVGVWEKVDEGELTKLRHSASAVRARKSPDGKVL